MAQHIRWRLAMRSFGRVAQGHEQRDARRHHARTIIVPKERPVAGRPLQPTAEGTRSTVSGRLGRLDHRLRFGDDTPI